MRNSFLPPLPSSSQLFGFGNNEYRMPQDNMDSYSMLDCKINVHTNCFLSLPKLFNDADFEKGIFGFHSQPIGDPQIAGYDRYESSSNNSSDIIDRNHQSSLLTMTHNSFFPHSTPAVHREKKRPLTLETEEESMKADNEKIKRRKPISSYAKQFHMSTPLDQLNDNQVKQVPVRRSQKIGDRITALQKLVSPYGKTDTASVLYEASLYIKILHAQIQVQETLLITFFFLFKKLYQMLPYGNGNGNGNGNGSSISMIRSLKAKESGGKLPMDLRSRGQCLVPISSIREVTKDNKA